MSRPYTHGFSLHLYVQRFKRAVEKASDLYSAA